MAAEARNWRCGKSSLDAHLIGGLERTALDSHVAAMIDAVCQGAYLSGRVDSRAREPARPACDPVSIAVPHYPLEPC
jgi:hypothetical protein